MGVLKGLISGLTHDNWLPVTCKKTLETTATEGSGLWALIMGQSSHPRFGMLPLTLAVLNRDYSAPPML